MAEDSCKCNSKVYVVHSCFIVQETFNPRLADPKSLERNKLGFVPFLGVYSPSVKAFTKQGRLGQENVESHRPDSSIIVRAVPVSKVCWEDELLYTNNCLIVCKAPKHRSSRYW